MKHLLVLCGVLMFAVPVMAQDEPFFGTPAAAAVLQNPGGVVGGVKETVNTTAPAVEELYDLRRGEWQTGTSISLWDFSPKQIPIASLRAGYAGETMPYGEVKIDVAGVATRYITPNIPVVAKDLVTAGVLNSSWQILGKYGHVGTFTGYSFENRDTGSKRGWAYGLSLGLQVTF